MPLILIIVGVITALGFGGFLFMHGPEGGGVEVVTPVARVEETSTVPSSDTPVEISTEETAVVPETPTKPAETPTAAPAAAPATTPATKPAPTPVTPTPVTTVPATAYKNGVYTVTTSYVAPGRSTHTVTTSVTIANDLVTNTTLSFGGDSVNESKSWQNKFTSKYQTLVVGKKLDDIALSRVGGASLTTNAYNKALAEVKTSARS